MSDVVYTAHAHTVGGRAGTARTDDGKLEVKLAYPPALGGDGNGTNPEQLFAAGYGACFTGALGLVAKNEKVSLGEHSVDGHLSTVDAIATAPRPAWPPSSHPTRGRYRGCNLGRWIRARR